MDEREFLESHAEQAYNLALRLTGNPTDAEDLAQEALLRALKALPGFREEASASTWLYRIVVNTWKNRVRSEKRRGFWKTVSLSIFGGEDEDRQPEIPAEEPALDAGLEAAEAADLLQKALLELDETSRAVVVLRDIEDRSYEQIAVVLQVPVGTVKSRLARARLALKEKVKRRVQL
jgi:RNA polymerase sigma-70 factor (ECF subfamily)